MLRTPFAGQNQFFDAKKTLDGQRQQPKGHSSDKTNPGLNDVEKIPKRTITP